MPIIQWNIIIIYKSCYHNLPITQLSSKEELDNTKTPPESNGIVATCLNLHKRHMIRGLRVKKGMSKNRRNINIKHINIVQLKNTQIPCI
jgi:hypothetical protein